MINHTSLLCYLTKRGHICTRPEEQGKCTLPRDAAYFNSFHQAK